MRVKACYYHSTKYKDESGKEVFIPDGIVYINGIRCVLVRIEDDYGGDRDSYYSTIDGRELNLPYKDSGDIELCSGYFEITF